MIPTNINSASEGPDPDRIKSEDLNKIIEALATQHRFENAGVSIKASSPRARKNRSDPGEYLSNSSRSDSAELSPRFIDLQYEKLW